MWVRSLGQEDPQQRAWQPTPVFLPGASHGQRSLVGYSPWGCKESDTTEGTQHTAHLNLHPKWLNLSGRKTFLPHQHRERCLTDSDLGLQNVTVLTVVWSHCSLGGLASWVHNCIQHTECLCSSPWRDIDHMDPDPRFPLVSSRICTFNFQSCTTSLLIFP